jgi:hypothetical protein
VFPGTGTIVNIVFSEPYQDERMIVEVRRTMGAKKLVGLEEFEQSN